MILQKEEKIYRSFIISVCLVAVAAIAGVFLGINIQARKLITESLHSTARAYFQTIVATRAWNARYNGVYVEKKQGVLSNPYMKNTDIETKDGRTFTIRNPAMMTREISEYIGKNEEFSFRMTSKKLVNPANKPDAFELAALDQFEKGVPEIFKTEPMNGKMYFRYIGPIFVKQECLKCHAKQNYKVGDVRGGISVTFNIDDIYKQLRSNTIYILLFAALTASFLVGSLWLLTKRLTNKIAEIRKQIEEMAIQDGLTGISNRRHAFLRGEEEFVRAKRLKRGLCCIMMDVDFFKAVNDKYGHSAGDGVLKELASRAKNVIRKYDILGRYGGEEFLVIMPDANFEQAKTLAERIRTEVKARMINDIPVTVSLGTAEINENDTRIDDIIKRADEQLYEAKKAGRNCVKP
ncbi:diguanylate cyclase [bacterium]|nr:MAG: diguanylate cyclase [bacterium]